MKEEGKYKLFTLKEFADWLKAAQIKRKISLIQNHHTAEPDYKDFHNNHFDLLKAMESYHVHERGFSDIAQSLTIFPDGLIAVCRSLELEPAGIRGANKGAVCIENVGNFDKDKMTATQQTSIVGVNALLCGKFAISIDTDHIVYHHWYDLVTGRRRNGKGIVKSCPGVGFFGGNTVSAAQKYFINQITKAKTTGLSIRK